MAFVEVPRLNQDVLIFASLQLSAPYRRTLDVISTISLIPFLCLFLEELNLIQNLFLHFFH